MTQISEVLRCSTRADVLAAPATLLGFMPEESVVLMHLDRNRVEFAARVGLDLLAADPTELLARTAHAQAVPVRPDGKWLVLVYAVRPQNYLGPLSDIVNELDADCYLTDGCTSWALEADDLVAPEPYDYQSTGPACSAVLSGRNVCRSREEAMTDLPVPHPDARLVGGVRDQIARWEPERQLDTLSELLDGRRLSPWEASVLAELLAQDELLAEVVSLLSMNSAQRWRASLEAALAASPRESSANLTALLGMVYWLSGNGALVNECLSRLVLLEPDHPLGRVLHRFIFLAIPPTVWDNA
ncbi:DUF4192 family protein [Tessaracoccus sp. OH4464_COT-324]|uniref:DUF4192 family protein n=1 Tax=Tessaracoccus sp. OH4464_COT-324 TaxID=2491059 RepID=UPI000F63756A|nr:DUF4192 family protein [Tessaracoccus sp. OH4464_COT-324]RRD47784.1 DUF4192 family protein [Tessaracoccus sp. OH4464_COT-324]